MTEDKHDAELEHEMQIPNSQLPKLQNVLFNL